MGEIKGIYAASVSILEKNLSLNITKTIKHAESLIDQGCHGVVIFGSTGQAQLISLSEKIELINSLSKSKYNSKFVIGTGLNSLNETVSLMKISLSLNFKNFLIMPPAYYKFTDKEVLEYYSKIVENVPEGRIILYNFEKLCGYKFSIECVEKLVSKFPNQIIGVKDSSYNLYDKIKIKNFSIFPGSELKLLKGLEIGCKGIITATCNVTAPMARKVYEDFFNKKDQTVNEKMCEVRGVFDKFNLISGIHTYLSEKDDSFKNILPTCFLLDEKDTSSLFKELKKLKFENFNFKAA
ncbi:MAG: dihydrodipicolinate synthase family protein [Pelagibacteraceae bacterium TMED246]|nr:MAG: dihydrodipicolinate synthase family protein [Pelagibacteraceae bacterium TMED246]|tara:strand:+ start:4106 stop:4990 length:885 start_codon:yes stop_codon:yes gene_type:complete